MPSPEKARPEKSYAAVPSSSLRGEGDDFTHFQRPI